MTDFPKGARVRIGQIEGVVDRVETWVHVQFAGYEGCGRFNSKFVELVDPVSGSNGTRDTPPMDYVGYQKPSSSDAPNETPVEEVADSELHARIRVAIADPGAILKRNRQDGRVGQDYETVASWSARAVIAAVVAPVLAAKDDETRRLRADLVGRVRALAVALGTEPDDTPTGGLYRMCQQVADMRIEVERLESNAEFSDRALHLVLGCCDPAVPANEDCQGHARLVYDAVRTGRMIPFHWPTVSRERDCERAARETFQLIVNEAGEALRKIADQNPWEQPPSLMDRIELVADRLREARAERDELRTHGVARDIGEANDQLRAELGALKGSTRLFWLPEFGEDEEIALGEPAVHNHADGRFVLRMKGMQAEPWKCGECRTINEPGADACELCEETRGPRPLVDWSAIENPIGVELDPATWTPRKDN